MPVVPATRHDVVKPPRRPRNCPLPLDAVAAGEKAQLRTVETCTYRFCSVNIEKPPPAIEYCHRRPLCACSSTYVPAEEELPCETLSSAWVITYLQLKRNCCAKPLSVSVPLLTSSRRGTVVRTPASAFHQGFAPILWALCTHWTCAVPEVRTSPPQASPSNGTKPGVKKITGQPVSSVVAAKAKVNRKRKPIMSSYVHNKKELGTGVHGLLREMTDAPISYIADEAAPEIEIEGRKYALGCGLSHQCSDMTAPPQAPFPAGIQELPLVSQIGEPCVDPGAATFRQPDDLPNFPLPSQPAGFCTVLNESAMHRYTELSISLPDSIALEQETREQSTNNLWFNARDCCNVMEDLQHMEELNVPSNLRLIMMKLPYKLREKWRSVTWELQERRGYRAMFPDFVAFIERQVKILSDPLFGDLQGTPSDSSSKQKSRHTGRGQATVAAINTALGSTTSAAWYQQHRGPASQRNDEELCCVCKSQHPVEKCSQLDEMSHREKLEVLKVGRVCFSCLRRGHMSRDCDKPLTCDICKHKHPTVLHIQLKTHEVSVNNASVSLETCGHTGAGSDECVLSIVPVQVKAKSGSTIMNTYAFLDPGSSASFCTQHLMRKLNLSGVKTSILLRTLGQERSVDTFLLSGLEVSGLNEENFLDLPEVYTQKTMPVSRNNILTQQDLEGWKYLKGITVPSLEAEVELLIGTNAPKLMEPWEIINSQGKGPYAVRTLLGWVVNGPLRGGEPRKGKIGLPEVTVNRISVAKLQD
ncbi:unnamed protein product [Leuciscus chuanchicus]